MNCWCLGSMLANMRVWVTMSMSEETISRPTTVLDEGAGCLRGAAAPGAGSSNLHDEECKVELQMKVHTRAFSWLKAATTAFTFKTLF